MDFIIFIILLVVVIAIYRDLKFVVYYLGILEIFFNLSHYIGNNLSFINLNSFVDSYIPTSILSMIDKYSSGIINDIISWSLVICFAIFLYYLIKYFFKKK